jgi:hypothetical protein
MVVLWDFFVSVENSINFCELMEIHQLPAIFLVVMKNSIVIADIVIIVN